MSFDVGSDAVAAAAALLDRGVQVSARAGRIRLSPHFYTTCDEIGAAFDALTDMT